MRYFFLGGFLTTIVLVLFFGISWLWLLPFLFYYFGIPILVILFVLLLHLYRWVVYWIRFRLLIRKVNKTLKDKENG